MGCGTDSTGAFFCWGTNADGTQGDGTSGDQLLTPTPAAPGYAFDATSASAQVCGLTNGDLYCWGFNDDGQVDGPGASPAVPVHVLAGTKFASVSAGRTQTCAITTAGEILCWGSAWGAPGASTNAIPGTWSAVSSTQGGVCAIDAAGVTCWTGPGTTAGTYAGTFTALDADFQSVCALDATGTLSCWDVFGTGTCYLGTASGSASSTPSPVVLPAGVEVASFGNGCFSSCLLSTTGDVYCWGRNMNGGTGQGALNSNVILPTQVAGIPPASAIGVSKGGEWACALGTAGARWCWGTNFYGQLGDGSASSTPVPTPVPGP
jgi:alpha-tubulin suppressor-like RCC1 family protein